jgi:hypothetical protein
MVAASNEVVFLLRSPNPMGLAVDEAITWDLCALFRTTSRRNGRNEMKCTWLLSEPCVFPAKLCGSPTRYKMVKDDDDRLVRKYDHLCPAHRVKAEAQPDEWSEQ